LNDQSCEIVLDLSCHEPWEIGAQLDAILCYPNFSRERQCKIANAICAKLVDGWITLHRDRKKELLPLRKIYTEAAKRVSINTLEKRRKKALFAGHIFLPLIKKEATGHLPVLRGEIRDLPLVEIARFLSPPEEGGYEENYVTRLRNYQENNVWPWYPIAHLAAAYQALARLRAKEKDSASFDYQDIDFHKKVVMLCNIFAEYFRASRYTKKIAKNLIRITLLE